MVPARFVLPVLALALLAACGRQGPAYDLPPGIYAQIVDMTTLLNYSPRNITIKAGEAVLWRNQSAFAHTVTFDPAKSSLVSLPAGAEPFSSGDIEQGETFAHKFTVPGTYRYVCRHHTDAEMFGAIIVTPAADRPPDFPAQPANPPIEGRLTSEGAECPAMRGLDGELYTLIGDLRGYRPGDRVCIVPSFVEMSYCQQGTTVHADWIGPAPCPAQ